ncbi:MAG: hypothetical protein NC131_10260 [Roseburia sp.]|nr:hypothetical protein [Roseburia sp.]
MKIASIKESGCNNTLLWALKNGADVYGDRALCSIINDELFYLITFSEVNMFELFRLTQVYRDKLKILGEKIADVPSRNVLKEIFPGNYKVTNEDGEKEGPLLEIAEHAIQMFMNLALQMHADNDIISQGSTRLFIPMIARNFEVQVPISFMDIITFFKDGEEAKKIFNERYPNTLNSIVDDETSYIRMNIELGFIKMTSIIKYNDRYEKYLEITKYAPLKRAISDKLYKFALTGFTKYDNVTHGECRCNMFNADKDVAAKTMKSMARLKTPLKVEFIVQLPIQLMQIIENTFSPEEIGIIYESSMANIINGDIRFDDFNMASWDMESEDPELIEKTKIYNEQISAYKERINEANKITLGAITTIIESDSDSALSSAFAMLPSVYTTKALLMLSTEFADKYLNIADPNLSDMFEEMMEMASNIDEDIQKTIKG